MSALTPAQLAVLERIQKKKELLAKKASKRKSKGAASPPQDDADSTMAQETSTEPAAQAIRPTAAMATKGIVETPKAERGRKAAVVSDEKHPRSHQAEEQVTEDTPKTHRAGRGRKTDLPATKSPSPVRTEDTTIATEATKRRGRKTVTSVETPVSSEPAMTQAQLDVLEKLKKKRQATEDAPKRSKATIASSAISKSTTADTEAESTTGTAESFTQAAGRGRRKTAAAADLNATTLTKSTTADVEAESATEAAESPTKPSGRGRRKTAAVADLNATVDSPLTSTMIETSTKSRRKTLAADLSIVAPVPEKESTLAGNRSFGRKKTIPVVDLDKSDSDSHEPEVGAMNANQLAVMELIKKKKMSKETASTAKARRSFVSAPPVEQRSLPESPAQPFVVNIDENNDGAGSNDKESRAHPKKQIMTPNQIAVIKRLSAARDHNTTLETTSEKLTTRKRARTESSSSENSVEVLQEGDVLAGGDLAELKSAEEFIYMLEEHSLKPTYQLALKRLASAGVSDAVANRKPLTAAQKELVANCRRSVVNEVQADAPNSTRSEIAVKRSGVRKRRCPDDLSSAAVSVNRSTPQIRSKSMMECSDVDTDDTEVAAVLESRSKKAKPAIDIEPVAGELTSDEDEMQVETTHTAAPVKKTFIIFDTNAYLHIYPYCKAVLECDKQKDDEDFEDVTMFALFVVIRELDFISKRTGFVRQAALSTIRMIHSALEDNNPRIEGQDFSSSKERLVGSNLNDDYILKSADLVSKRGDSVLVVTDDTNLQVKIAMMRLPALGLIDFISRFHWLTPIVTANLSTDMKLIGEDATAAFAETVVTSIMLKAVMAQLSPMPMEERRALFPSKKLAVTLAHTLKHKRLLEERGEPFASVNYDRVGTTLSSLSKFREDLKSSGRLTHFARFLHSAAILTRSIATFFSNMQTRAELVAVLSNAYQHHLPAEERLHLHLADVKRTRPRIEEHCVVSSAASSVLGSTATLSHTSTTSSRPHRVLLPTPRAASPMAVRKETSSGSSTAQERPDAGYRAPAETRPVQSPPQPATRPTRSGSGQRSGGNDGGDALGEPEEPVYFSFSRGQRESMPSQQQQPPPPSAGDVQYHGTVPYSFRSNPTVSPRRPTASTTANTSSGPAPLYREETAQGAGGMRQDTSPYAACQDLISEDVIQTVYDYFQQFGTAVCNYTGSCCVKMGVRFSLAFTASGAPLEKSLQEVTDAFAPVLQSMKKLITEVGATTENARLFLQHSGNVMRLIAKADPHLVVKLPEITPYGLLQFVADVNGKTHLAAGYHQFCDFNNCLEKCWLDLQRRI